MPEPLLPSRQIRVTGEDRWFRLTEDRHQQALHRLAAVEQYLYDTMNGDHDSDRDTPDPLPQLAMEKVREIQQLLFWAIKHGQRTRRSCLGGYIELIEQPGHMVKDEADAA